MAWGCYFSFLLCVVTRFMSEYMVSFGESSMNCWKVACRFPENVLGAGSKDKVQSMWVWEGYVWSSGDGGWSGWRWQPVVWFSGGSRRWCATELGTRLGDWILKMGRSAVSLSAFLAWVVCGLPRSCSWSWGPLPLSGRSGEGHQVALTSPPLSKRVTFVLPWPFIRVNIFFSNSNLGQVVPHKRWWLRWGGHIRGFVEELGMRSRRLGLKERRDRWRFAVSLFTPLVGVCFYF